MTTQTEALKLALEALERLDGWLALRYGSGLTPEEKQTVTAIKEALMSLQDGAKSEPLEGLKLIHKADIDLAKKRALEHLPAAQLDQEPVAWPMEEQPDGSVIPVDPSEMTAEQLQRYTTPQQRKEPAQKYRRGNRLICLETEEYCVIHISGTDRQWVKFPDSHIGVYTNEQVAELFELLPKEPEQHEPAAWEYKTNYIPNPQLDDGVRVTRELRVAEVNAEQGTIKPLFYTTPPQRKPLTDDQIFEINNGLATWMFPVETRLTEREIAFARAIEAAHDIKE